MSEQIPERPLSDASKVMSILDKISLLGGLSPEQLERVLGLLKLVNYRAQEQIFRQGDKPSYIYIVLTGAVRLVFDLDEHPMSKVEFSPGACFGETSVIGILPHSGSTIATADTELLVLSRDALMDLYESDLSLFSQIVLNIAREACRRLYQADQQWLHYLRPEDD